MDVQLDFDVVPPSDSDSDDSELQRTLISIVNERDEELLSAEELGAGVSGTQATNATDMLQANNHAESHDSEESADEYNDSEPSEYDPLTVDVEMEENPIVIPLQNYEGDVEHPDDLELGWEWLERDPGASYGPFTGPSGLLIDVGETPEHYFNAFFDPNMWHHLADETNKYARQSLGNLRKGCDSIACLDDPEYKRRGRLNFWADINASDLRIFMAHQIVMGLVRKSKLVNYWKRHAYIDTPFFGKYMNRTNFERILSNIHLSLIHI